MRGSDVASCPILLFSLILLKSTLENSYYAEVLKL